MSGLDILIETDIYFPPKATRTVMGKIGERRKVTMSDQVPDAARLSNEQIATLRNTRYIPGVFYDIARASENHAWHSRDTEINRYQGAVEDQMKRADLTDAKVAELQAQLTAAANVALDNDTRVDVPALIAERDAALAQRAALVGALEIFLVYIMEDLADQDGEVLRMPKPYETIFAALDAARNHE